MLVIGLRGARTVRPHPWRGIGVSSIAAVLLLLAFLAAPATARAQTVVASPEYVRENWTVADGLPINTITAIVQTRDGYLWLGTNDGVVRFDGVRFTVFNADNTPELPSNRIVSLYEDRAGALWILTEQQHLIQYLRGRFTHVNAERGLQGGALRLSEGSDGTLVLTTTRGAGILEGARFTPVADSLQMPVDNGGGAVKRSDGSIWIAQQRGLRRVAGGRIEDVTPPALRGLEPWRVAQDPAGRLWLSTEHGVWIEDRGWHEVRGPDGPIPHVMAFRFDSSGKHASLLGYDRVAVATDTIARYLSHFARQDRQLWPAISIDSAGTAWYANGPELFHDGRRILALEGAPGDNLAPGAIMSVVVDREGSIWLGTRASGLHRLKPSIFGVVSVREGLTSGNVYPIYEDPWGSVWVGALEAGASRIDGGGTRITNFTPRAILSPRGAPVYTDPRNPRDFLSDRPDRLWVAALGGIWSCTLPAFRCTGDTSPALANFLDVHALTTDARGRLWAGVADGVLRYEGRWERVAGWPLKGIQVRAFVNAPDGALWMATGGGGIVRHKDGRFTQVSVADGLPGDVVRALYVDPDGFLWIGTEGRGLARLDPRAWGDSTRDRHIVRIGTQHGLYDGAIHRILADDAGRLWMNTNRGIFWVPRADLVAFAEGRVREVHSTAYTERDGLRNREGNGGVGSAGTRTKDGRLWFPTQDGVAIVDPRSVTARRITPPAVIERVVAGDSTIIPSGAPVRVGVDDRDLAIEYTALSLLEPKNLRFRYRLEPYDAGWVDAGNRRIVYYTQVPPGNYIFHVEAASPDAEFGASGAELPVSLAFRPWETAGFRIALVVAIIGLLSGIVVLWSRRVRARAAHLELVVAERTATVREREQQLALQNVRLTELDRAKSHFFANVSHEFRTPLTLTIGPLEGVIGKVNGADGSVTRALDMALRNARRLLRLVNQILDVAKLEAGQMRLARRDLDLAAFVRTIAEAFAPAASGKGIVLDVETPTALRGGFDSDALEKIVSNLLSNALKFTPGGGRVTLTLGAADGGVMLRVADTGPGIPDKHLPHVFERFYQVDESLTRAEPGTGIGLALVHELVVLHGGTITVSSGDLAPGAVFTVTLPLGVVDPDTDETRAVVVEGSEPRPATLNGAGLANDGEGGGDADDIPTLLIVDDSPDLRSYVRDHFAPRFRVLEAADGAEGIDVARRELPDVVVSDLMMPNTDGHRLVRALRASHETDFLPIILLTAHTAMEQRLTGLQGGADDYVTKPFDMRELEARVENLIALRRRLRALYMAPAVEAPAPAVESLDQVDSVDHTELAYKARVEAAIGRHLADPDFGVGELAAAVSQDRSHLFRRTRDLFGTSPSDLIRQARLRQGATLLAESGDTVAEIAYAVGFNSVSYFSRCFQAEHGMTPTAFRERTSTRT